MGDGNFNLNYLIYMITLEFYPLWKMKDLCMNTYFRLLLLLLLLLCIAVTIAT